MYQPGYQFWHPMLHPNAMKVREPLRIVRGEGCYVFDDAGNKLVDGMAGLWNVNVGHGRGEVKRAMAAQLDELAYFPIFDGLTHPRAEELSNLLVELLAPEEMRRVLYSSGGSDAVETALRLARQYWKAAGQPERSKFIALKQGCHGTHAGAASVSGNPGIRRSEEPLLPGCFHVDTPWTYRNPFTRDPDELASLCASLLEREIVFQGPDTVAAFIAEPVQGVGGVIVPPASYWPLVREVCDRHGVLLIADEVVTGFGRAGAMSGSRLWGVKPDIMCLAKGITSGYFPLGATMFNQRIVDAFDGNGDSAGAVFHGYTYSGHPVGCAAALANLKIVREEQLAENAARMGAYLLARLLPLAGRHAAVGEVRGQGLMLAIDLVADQRTRAPLDPTGAYAARVAEIARLHGAIVRPLGSTIIVSPPLVIEESHADRIVAALAAGVAGA